MKEKRKYSKKLVNIIALLTMMTSFFISPFFALAAHVTNDTVGNWVSTWHLTRTNGIHWTDQSVNMKKADGVVSFCIEHGVSLNVGTGFEPTEYNSEKLSLIAYYGYYKNPNAENYGITQNIIWEELGDTLLTTNLPNYNARKGQILDQVNQHHTKPSFSDTSIELNAGDSITLTDTNNVLEKYSHLQSNSANLQIDKNGKQLKLTATTSSKESGNLQYSIADSKDVGTSFVYHKAGEQRVVSFKLPNAGLFKVNVKVNLNGNARIRKIDKTTGLPLANVKMLLEYNDTKKEALTDDQGYIELNDIKAGTELTVTELQALDGYFNYQDTKKITIQPNQTVDLIFENMPQQGIASLKKTGKTPISFDEKETEFGLLYEFKFEYEPLQDVSYDIQATEDIKTADGTLRAKNGDTVASLTTDEEGLFITDPLFLGKYQAVEQSASNGFVVDSTPIPFELNYEGQFIELVSTSLPEQKNEFQTLTLNLLKDEEIIQNWKDNLPIIEKVKANGKIFGLFTNEELSFTDKILEKDSLINYGTVVDGTLTFENLQYPEGAYYFKELDAGDNHILDTEHYEFEFKPSDNESVKEITITDEKNKISEITDNTDTHNPLLNQLHFNQFSFKKVNEEATLISKNGYTFDFTGNAQGAVFSLEDENNDVIQTLEIDQDSIAHFENIPVGTFYLKEQKTSAENYVLSKEVIRIESSKNGISAYDEQDKLLGEQTIDSVTEDDIEATEKDDSVISESEVTTPLLLFEIKNHLIKGTSELTKKDVSTGELLPNTGVQILDKNKKIVTEGRTDDNGVFTFENLPKGSYYFKEFDALPNYELDETPIEFQITKDGEVVKCEMTNRKKPTEKLPDTGETLNRTPLLFGCLLTISVVCYFIYKKKNKKQNEH
ncbi:Cys-Gln thioester bond-forming surface protein [Enterococcus plantarum]|uniref:SpaA isopeptide-forming pilin-related protein n=1 Tax=Enterococcus plantarum TaxID=1077675 RepID=UPI001A8FAB52|nr:SpaA isopeptide-forming pilin-related protein [Enterococcus plantarum]MBO0468571.1 Cys-Gln thioester bond-forming surface protein [Enterococcus plantarum]